MFTDMEGHQFSGLIDGQFEKLYGASLPGEEAMPFRYGLYQRYQSEEKAAPPKTWVKSRLRELRLCAGEKPRWVESILPTWPFLEGNPMVFLHQFHVPANEVTINQVSPDVVLYVFGCRRRHEAGWTMEYHVVEQHRNL